MEAGKDRINDTHPEESPEVQAVLQSQFKEALQMTLYLLVGLLLLTGVLFWQSKGRALAYICLGLFVICLVFLATALKPMTRPTAVYRGTVFLERPMQAATSPASLQRFLPRKAGESMPEPVMTYLYSVSAPGRADVWARPYQGQPFQTNDPVIVITTPFFGPYIIRAGRDTQEEDTNE